MVSQINPTGANFRARTIKGSDTKLGSAGKIAEKPANAVDRVEISELAWWLGKYAEMPETRPELVEKVRSQIQQGTYDSEGKIDQAVENLMEDLIM